MVSHAYVLDKFKFRYRRVKIGDSPRDVTYVFSTTKSRLITEALNRGERVFAVPLLDGKGIFDKFKLKPDGLLARDAEGRPLIRNGPRQTVGRLVCNPNTPFIASDDLVVGKERSIQGFSRKDGEAIFVRLNIDPNKDSYALFICSPENADKVVGTFKERLTGILRDGKNWEHYYKINPTKELEARPFDFEDVAGQFRIVFQNLSRQLELQAHKLQKEEISAMGIRALLEETYCVMLDSKVIEFDMQLEAMVIDQKIKIAQDAIIKLGNETSLNVTVIERFCRTPSIALFTLVASFAFPEKGEIDKNSVQSLLKTNGRRFKTLSDVLDYFKKKLEDAESKIRGITETRLKEADEISAINNKLIERIVEADKTEGAEKYRRYIDVIRDITELMVSSGVYHENIWGKGIYIPHAPNLSVCVWLYFTERELSKKLQANLPPGYQPDARQEMLDSLYAKLGTVRLHIDILKNPGKTVLELGEIAIHLDDIKRPKPLSPETTSKCLAFLSEKEAEIKGEIERLKQS